MSSEIRRIYVIDTNVLVDYPDIVPYDSRAQPEQPTVDVGMAHLVVPSAVIREESNFKKEHTGRGKTSRVFLRRNRDEEEKNPVPTMEEVYNFKPEAAIKVGNMDTLVSTLPVHKNFKNCLPFAPSDDDMDGQIILTTLTVMAVEAGLPIDGTADMGKMMKLCGESSAVTLLTNDNGLASRARMRGIKTCRYGYKYPKPYTGRRDVIVPPEIFAEFWKEGKIERDIWEMFMPDEAPLVANEFLVMKVADPSEYPPSFTPNCNPYFRHIGRYDAEIETIVKLRHVSTAPFRVLSDGQAMYAEALLEPSIAAIVCTGPAGSGKTYLPTVYGIDACQKGTYTDVVVVPCADLGKMGALPGNVDDKMILDVGPFRNAIRNYLLKEHPHFKRELEKIRSQGVQLNLSLSADEDNEKQSLNDKLQAKINLIWRLFFRNIPVEKARGLDFSCELMLYDEFQDQSPSQADMLIKRIGQDGKLVITGDIKQIHAPYLDEANNGIIYASRQLYDSPMVARVSLIEDEVKRHELVKMIAKRQKGPSADSSAANNKPK